MLKNMSEYYVMPEKEKLDLNIDENIKIEIDDWSIRDVLSLGLYRDYTAGIRELYANAINACLTAKEKYGASPKIVISLDTKHAKLTITEIDSMGMSRDVFKNVYCVLGRSGNFDGTKPGMFGVGMAAYRALSDTMIIELYSRETEEKMAFFCDNMIEFKELKHNPPTLEKYGTKITMTLRPPKKAGQFLITKETDVPWKQDPWAEMYESIMTASAENAKFAGITTLLDVPNDIKTVSFPLGMYSIIDEENGNMQYYVGPLCAESHIGKPVFLSIDTDDFELDLSGIGYNFITLAGMPIQHENLSSNTGLPFHGYVLKIKNERKYLPTVSRDELTLQAENDIYKLVIESVAKAIIKIGNSKAKYYLQYDGFFILLSNLKKFIDACKEYGKCEYSLSPSIEKEITLLFKMWCKTPFKMNLKWAVGSTIILENLIDCSKQVMQEYKQKGENDQTINKKIFDDNISCTNENDQTIIKHYLRKFPKNHIILELTEPESEENWKELAGKLKEAGIPDMKTFKLSAT